jgi:hypothetical protein
MRCNDTCCRPDPRPEFLILDGRRVVARIEHHCIRCRSAITAGQSYIRTVGLNDGNFFTDKVHETPCIPGADDYY